MSRIGKLPINVPNGVTVTVSDDNTVSVKGPKGALTQKVHKDITVTQEGGVLHVSRPSDSKPHRAMHGLYRALSERLRATPAARIREARVRVPDHHKVRILAQVLIGGRS